MSNPASIQFSGHESLNEIFTRLPDQYQRPVMLKIFAKAAAKFISSAKKDFNGSLKKSIGYVQGKSKDRPAIYAGLVHKSGNSWQYQRAYWRNFGTLTNRDPSHSFVRPRKGVSAKWRGGQLPLQAVGKAWEQTQGEAERVINQDAAKIANDYLTKKAKRR